MPLFLNLPAAELRSRHCIKIGLINNMADEALKATERQYVSLLGAASTGLQVHLSLYTLPGIARGDASARHIAAHYASIDDLWDGQLDGLIVTGREPLAASLTDEPYWDSFTRTLEWAQENAHSTVWSCLAAHAAVLHLDGIQRVKRDDKLFGIFECARFQEHALLAGASAPVRLPHSRWNGLPEHQLAEAGYSVLTRAAGGEVDTFIRQRNKLFIFFQGHPEYEADTLLREYRRDVLRYFHGETLRYPLMPQNYFAAETVTVLQALQTCSRPGHPGVSAGQISAALSNLTIENTWHASATSIYRNWLRHIQAQKTGESALKSTRSVVGPAAVPCVRVAI